MDFLVNELHELMEDVPFNLRQNIWLQLNGCLPHSLIMLETSMGGLITIVLGGGLAEGDPINLVCLFCCQEDSSGNETYSSCEAYAVNWSQVASVEDLVPDSSWPKQPCLFGWEYSKDEYQSSIVIDFDLVCEKKIYPTIGLAALNTGGLIGVYMFGIINDKFGRRHSFFLCLSVLIFGNVSSALMTNFWSWAACRFIAGLTIPAIYQIPFIISLELVGPNYRSFVTVMTCMFYTFGLIFLAAITYMERDWTQLSIVTSLPFVVYYIYWWSVSISFCFNKIPSYLTCWVVMDRWGRRWPLSICMILSGISCVITVLLPPDAVTLTLVLFLFSKFTISASFLIIYPFAGELYPTQLRGVGIGASAYIGGIGMIMIPFITYLGTDNLILPLVIMGCVSVIGGVTGLRLPETLHHRLPQTLEEGEEFGKDWTITDCLQCIPKKPSSTSGSYEDLDKTRVDLEMREEIPVQETPLFGKPPPKLVRQASIMETPLDASGSMKMTYWF
ncbi:carcinine transporter [Nilaparvata lugens]|uniref:carcinine transporter n=1 Tax=Nilaparvata lugens TaxID=108931 RepID=UPI00193DAEF0|nr:carcinine transporter [Nilaparvata lugens]